MTADDYAKLSVLLDAPVELLRGRMVHGDFDYVCSPALERAAKRLGVKNVPSCVEAVLEDPEALATMRARLAELDACRPSSPTPRPDLGDEVGERARYPGEDLVTEGLDDLGAGRHTAAGLLVAMASTRLRAASVPVPDHGVEDPARELFLLLEADDPRAAHASYNALQDRLVSYCLAVEAEARRRER